MPEINISEMSDDEQRRAEEIADPSEDAGGDGL